MNVLIIKLNAAGDVVRTTPLLSCLEGEITWITARGNLGLLDRLAANLRSAAWEDREIVRNTDYDLVINLEDDAECAAFTRNVRYRQLFGAYLGAAGNLTYSEDSRSWFDLSLISVYGKKQADQLKLRNRRSYQEMIFEGLGFQFRGETYLVPEAVPTDLTGDVAIAPVAGAVWPMKNWAYYKELKHQLEAEGLKVNVLPHRASRLEHLGDIQNHRCLVGGDSLPMHLALGSETPCVSLFTCTSPWEIYDYGIQRKIVSPLLREFFYRRDFDVRATTAIRMDEVLRATVEKLQVHEAQSSSLSHVGI
ncbi:MAG: glycosyltransferase family 9 protein [Chthoniobacterales bacterium]